MAKEKRMKAMTPWKKMNEHRARGRWKERDAR